MPVLSKEKSGLIAQMRGELLPEGCTFSPELLYAAAEPLISLAVSEDVPNPDLVDARMIVDRKLTGEAAIVANSEGIFTGGWLVGQIAAHYSKAMTVEIIVRDGSHVRAGQTLGMVRGPVAKIVTAERVFLNFISRLSGISTMTWRCVQAVAETGGVVTDTRKTLPAYRVLDKYAVQCGGGKNHRMGLCDGVMIKDNHIYAMSELGIDRMVRRVRNSLKRRGRDLPIWVEVDRLEQLVEALKARPDLILLDNMSLNQLRTSVAMRNEWFEKSGIASPRPIPFLEASGGVDLSNIADVGRTGVDRIAVGALTHSAPALDLTLELKTSQVQPTAKSS